MTVVFSSSLSLLLHIAHNNFEQVSFMHDTDFHVKLEKGKNWSTYALIQLKLPVKSFS